MRKSRNLLSIIYLVPFALCIFSCDSPASTNSNAQDSTVTHYYVTFNPNGGNGDEQKQMFIKDSTQNLKTISELGFSKDGYSFAGWAVTIDPSDADCGQAKYGNGAPYSANNNIKLYALWSQIPLYTINLATNPNGTITANPPVAAEGSVVTINITPNTNYLMESITATSTDGSNIVLTKVGDNMTFVMPNQDVSVNATYFPGVKATISTIQEVLANLTQDTTIVMTDFGTNLGWNENNNPLRNAPYKITLDLSDAKGLQELGELSFKGCQQLREIRLPSSLRSIGRIAFYGCDNLEKIIVDPKNNYFVSEDGVLFNKEKTTLIKVPATKSGTFDIPFGVVTIDEDALGYCKNLTAINIPNSVTTIKYHAFCGCFGLTEILIPNSVTDIERYAFNGCKNLTSIVIPNSVLTIGSDAFSGCSGAISATIGNSLENIGDHIFSYCTNLKDLSILNKKIGAAAFNKCTSLTTVTIPDTVTSIEDRAFEECSGLSHIYISNSVKMIGNYAFTGCNNLTEVNVPSSVESIGKYVFSNCSKLQNINIAIENPSYSSTEGVLFNNNKSILIKHPDGKSGTYNIPGGVIKIEEAAFNGCSNLTGVTIPNTVSDIGDSAFRNCDLLTDVCIPTSILNIGSGAYNSCDGLTNVTISSSVVSIGPGAFYNCSNLSSFAFSDAKGWYRTYVKEDWIAKRNGALTDVSNPSVNVFHFRNDYSFGWYKVQN